MRIDGGIDLAAGREWLDLVNLDLSRWSGPGFENAGGALWRQLAIEGRVARANFRSDRDSGVRAEFLLQGVNLTTPVPAEPDEEVGPDYPLMRLRGVDGTIAFDAKGFHADLRGAVEDMPGRVRLDTEGLSLVAPLRCEIATEQMIVNRQPLLLPFAPPEVRRLFREFSGPTAKITGVVVLTRGEPVNGEAAPIASRGSISFENGRASHSAFPYPAEQMSGTVTFDGDRVDIVRITGVGPTGASLLADGWLRTGRGDAVDINVTFADVPVDGALREAMPEGYTSVIDAICDPVMYERLLGAGLVQTRAEHDGAASRLEVIRASLTSQTGEASSPAARESLGSEAQALESRLRTPVFEPGGMGHVSVSVRRPKDGPYTRTVEVRFSRLGALPTVFPYPFYAHDVRLLIENEETVTVTASRLEGLTGGSGALGGVVSLRSDGAPALRPEIALNVESIPIDPLLIAAFPDDGSGATPVRAWLDDLGLRGVVSAHATITAPAGDASPVSALITLAGVEIAPKPLAAAGGVAPVAPLDQRQATGPSVGPAPLVTDLRGDVAIRGDSIVIGPLRGRLGEGTIEIDAAADLAPAGDPATAGFRAEIAATDLDLTLEIERLIAPFSGGIAGRIAELRSEAAPSGVLDARAVVAASAAGGVEGSASLSGWRGASFGALGGRVGLERTSGAVTASAASLRFDAFSAAVSFNGEPAGIVALDGASALTPGGQSDLRIGVSDGRLESGLWRTLCLKRLEESVSDAVAAADPRGAFSAEARLNGDGASVRLEGAVSPHSLSFRIDGALVEFPEMEGSATFGPDGGEVRGLTARAERFSATADGRWFAGAQPGVDLAIEGSGERLTDDILAIIPSAAREAIRSIDLRADGGFTLAPSRLLYRPAGPAHASDRSTEAEHDFIFDGTVRFAGLSLNAGGRLEEMTGGANIRAVRRSGSRDSAIEVDLRADSLRFAGVPVTNARAVIRSGESADDFEITQFLGEVYGGRAAGWGRIRAGAPRPSRAGVGPGGPDGPRGRYEAELSVVGLDIASAIGESAASTKERRAALDGRINLAGAIDDPGSSRGLGEFRISGGSIVRLPLLLPVIELSNLQPPTSEGIERAEGRFFIDGRTAIFDRLIALSNSIAVVGEGTATWPGLSLDLRFKTRGNLLRLPFVSDLIDAVRNEILAIRVTGTLQAPQFNTDQMPVTRRMFEDVFDTRPAGRQRPQAPQGTITDASDR